MKRILCALLALCLLAALLSGCAGELPPVPPLPGTESPSPAQEDEDAGDAAVIVESDPVEVPEALELGFSLPAADPRGEELAYYFSGAEEFDCAFVYPSYCSVWVEKGAIRFNPGWFFARMFFTSVPRGSENAPEELIDLLEVGKWGTYPEEGEAGTGWTALRALHLKYDTWRDWIAWETPERFFLLYGACFDGREEVLGSIFETVAESFRTNAELLSAAPESGTLLRRSGSLSLFYDGAALGGGTSAFVEVRLLAANRGEQACSLTVSAYTADGRTLPFEAACELSADEEQLWTLSLPILPEEGGAPFESLGLLVNAQDSTGTPLFELPVRIELNR